MFRHLAVVFLLALSVGLLTRASFPVHAAQGDTVLVSAVNATTSTKASGDSGAEAMSADGRYVAFASFGSNLTTDTDNDSGGIDVYRRDTQTNATILISKNAAGTGTGNQGSGAPTISADGRYVAFQSSATTLVTGVSGQHIYLRDATAGTTRVVDRASGASDAGAVSNGSAINAYVSATGQYVVFACQGCTTILPGGAVNTGNEDIFIRDMVNDTTQRVNLVNGASVDSGSAVVANASAYYPSVSSDGNLVTFVSIATNFADPNYTPSGTIPQQVWLRNISAHTTRLVSRASGATGAAGDDQWGNTSNVVPEISADGSHVVWASNSQNLVPNSFATSQTITFTVNGTVSNSTPAFTSPNSFACYRTVECHAYVNAVSSPLPEDVTCTAGCTGGTVDGLSVVDGTFYGLIQGTPSANGSFPITLTADNGSHTNTQSVTINVSDPPASLSLANATSVTLTSGQIGDLGIDPSNNSAKLSCGPDAAHQVNPNLDSTCGGALPTASNNQGVSLGIYGGCTCIGQLGSLNTLSVATGSHQVVVKAFLVQQAIFVRDLGTLNTTRVNVNSSNVQSPHFANYPSISPTGQFIAFDSEGFNDLVAGAGNNSNFDVFLRDIVNGTTVIASLGNGNTSLDGTAYSELEDFSGTITVGGAYSLPQAVDTAGRYVAFQTPDGGNGSPFAQVYRHQLLANAAAPSVTSSAATSIGSTSAQLNGTVTADGGATLTDRGFAYSQTSLNSNPTPGGPNTTKLQVLGQTGAFNGLATPLLAATQYSFVAYGTNSAGTTVSTPVLTFTTLPSGGGGSCTGGTPYQNLNGNWAAIPGAVNELGADKNPGNTTSVWALGTNAVPGGCGIYQYVGGASTWVPINGGATSLTVDNTGQPWVLQAGNNHAIYRYSGGAFSAIPGAAYEISAGAGGDIWAIGTNLVGPGGHGIYKYVGAPNWWQPINGAADHVAVGPDNVVWLVQTNGDIYRYSGGLSGTFTAIPGKAQQISVGYDNTLYVIGTNAVPGGYGLYRYIGGPSTWVAISGGAEQIVGGGSGEFWVHQGGSVPPVPNALGVVGVVPFVAPLPAAVKPAPLAPTQSIKPPSQVPQTSPAPSGNTLPGLHQ